MIYHTLYARYAYIWRDAYIIYRATAIILMSENKQITELLSQETESLYTISGGMQKLPVSLGEQFTSSNPTSLDMLKQRNTLYTRANGSIL